MSQSSSRMGRWTITLLVLCALVAAVLPIPAARATGIRPIQPAATSTASITRVSPTGSTTWPCGSGWGATCTLQTALTNAVSGDEIWVATGVYTPGLAITATFQLTNSVGVYGGFAMTETLRSQRNIAANVTVLSGDIDGNDLTDSHGVVTSTTNITGTNAYHVVTVGSGVTTAAVLDGFTITGGNANGAWPNDGGGGIYTHIGSPTLTNITFSGNSAYSGGGMVNIDSSPTLMNVTFSGNAAHDGGGMYNGQLNVAGSPTLTNVTFSGNMATANGGGMNNYNTNPTLTNVTFSGNSARDAGGGMVNFSGSPTLTNVTFSGNTVQVNGGGLYNGGGTPTLTNVTFSGNLAGWGGGGMFSGLSNPTLTNVTFSGNTANNYGGGLYAYSNSNPTIRNTLLWGNTALTGTQVYNQGSTPVISYSVVQGGCPTGSTCANINTADPRLAALGNYGGGTQTVALLPGSSAINAGNDTVCPSTDQRGVMRPQSTHCDIGAFEYEYAVGVHYASPTAAGAGDCSSWANACDLQTALTWAVPGDEIWVGTGVHKPTTGSDRTVSFQLKSGVGVYGGFVMTETLRSQRNIAANVTVLSGDIDSNDLTDPHGVVTSTINITGTNAYHVVTGSGVTPTAVLDGFTVTGGNANGLSPNDRGGGLYNFGGSPTLTNVTFSGNSAASRGGGLYNFGGSPTLTNVTFSGNSATHSGGGVYNFDRSSPTLTNVTFSGNSATHSGGGMYNDSSSPTLTNVTFSGNSAPGGGGMYNDYSNPALTNVTFSGNFAQGGGGMYNYFGSSPTIRNTILWGNTASNGAQVYNYSSTPAISDSVVQGGCPADSTCANVITTDPRLGALGNYTCPGGQCQGGGTTQTFPLLPGSSAIDATSANCPATDQRGVIRPQGSACDIGAFESRGFTLTKTGGDDQSALINTTFALPLQTTLTETGGQPLSGVVITYTAPSFGASASWSGSTTITRTTDSNGNAVAPVLTANGTLGSYAVTANMSGVPLAIFVLHNAKGNTTATINSSANPSLFGHTVTFTVTVASPSGGTPTGTVEFYETTSPAASSFDSLRGSGRAQTLASKPLVGGVVTFTASSLAVGTHTMLAIYSGDASYNASTSALYVQGVITHRVYLPLVIRP